MPELHLIRLRCVSVSLCVYTSCVHVLRGTRTAETSGKAGTFRARPDHDARVETLDTRQTLLHALLTGHT
eukprot:scaffold17331_cov66-Phaeocystis_antarctica.AAC.2